MSDRPPTDEPPLYEEALDNNTEKFATAITEKPPPEEPSNGRLDDRSNFAAPSNTFFVKPTSVNISQANPDNLHPQYPDFLQREQLRTKNGDHPRDRSQFKHGAPLNPGHTSASSSSKSFPGSSGVTYHNAVNR